MGHPNTQRPDIGWEKVGLHNCGDRGISGKEDIAHEQHEECSYGLADMRQTGHENPGINDSTGGKEEQHRFASDPVTDEASQRLPEHEDE